MDNYHIVLWTGKLEETALKLHAFWEGKPVKPIDIKSAMVMGKDRDLFYCCDEVGVARYNWA